MRDPLGSAAALASSATWAYASARYALASREVSPVRVNFVRVLIALPIFVTCGLVSGGLGQGLGARAVSWLALSTLCSYAFADSLFFAAARRIGVSSALAIASSYPLWAALKGTLIDGEAFGTGRAFGTLLCVGGVAAIIKLGQAPQPAASASQPAASASLPEASESQPETPRDRIGVPLAIATSFLWAGNTIAIKSGSLGLSVYTVNSVRYALAVAILAVTVALGRPAGPRRPQRGWLPMLPAVIADCVFGSILFVYGLTHTDLAIGATLSSLAPLLSLPFALWLGVERLSLQKLAAVATTVAGIVLLATR